MVRKCRGIAEIAVMEVAQVGVRTRAQAALAMAATSSDSPTKRRKLDTEELQFSSTSTSSYVQLKSRRRLEMRQDSTEERRCSSPSSDHATSSCCSSNGSSSLVPEEARIKFVDLQEGSAEVETSTYSCCRERRETTPSSELRAESANPGATAQPTEVNSRTGSTVAKRPTQAEIDEFFAAAENDMQKRFAEKYNFDIVNDVPLEGRYEWVRLKP